MRNTPLKKHYHTVLAIAGSDSIAGAGIQADIKTCSALGAYAMTVITALTAQNTTGVLSSMTVSADMIRAQLEAVLTDVRPDAVKIGMLPTVDAVRIVADAIHKYALTDIVIDPVWMSTSGYALVAEEVPEAMRSELFPLATVVTPNVPEASRLLGYEILEPDARETATQLLQSLGSEAVLLKGGHFKGAYATDYLAIGDEIQTFGGEKINSKNTHGTGCTLSSAIAAFLAHGYRIIDAVRFAVQYVHGAIEAGASYEFGRSHGPLNHFYNRKSH